NVAVGDGYVAVTWEDNRAGRPAVFIAFKAIHDRDFAHEYRLSDARLDAYEPAVSALPGDRFMVAFEQDGFVYAIVADPSGTGTAQRIGQRHGAQPTLVTRDAHTVLVAWSEDYLDGNSRIQTCTVTAADSTRALTVGPVRPLENQPPPAKQLYPALAWSAHGPVVAWEDRRHGHTRIVASAAAADAFTTPREINEFLSERSVYDRGSGAARVVLGSNDRRTVAVWMDKREGGKGYSLYAAWSDDGGRTFGSNQPVHDAFGQSVGQVNPAVASNRAGETVVAWDDARVDDADIWLATPAAGGWSENIQVPPASGEGEQSNASLALDKHGNVHLVWIERAVLRGPTRLWYSLGLRHGS
ncbi:MAG: hypothetical protein OET44_11885, partial [Gammaproteobacteria bacterium]|nr:hypothetical protein [Gammaproteobacteria bacterium]